MQTFRTKLLSLNDKPTLICKHTIEVELLHLYVHYTIFACMNMFKGGIFIVVAYTNNMHISELKNATLYTVKHLLTPGTEPLNRCPRVMIKRGEGRYNTADGKSQNRKKHVNEKKKKKKKLTINPKKWGRGNIKQWVNL
jgi:hypothetical protein